MNSPLPYPMRKLVLNKSNLDILCWHHRYTSAYCIQQHRNNLWFNKDQIWAIMGERCGDKLEVNLVEATGKIKGRPSEANHSVSLFLSSMHGCPKIMANLYIFYFDWASPDRIGLYFCAPSSPGATAMHRHYLVPPTTNNNAPSSPGANIENASVERRPHIWPN